MDFFENKKPSFFKEGKELLRAGLDQATVLGCVINLYQRLPLVPQNLQYKKPSFFKEGKELLRAGLEPAPEVNLIGF